MQLTLAPETLQRIEAMVDSGNFASPEEVIEQALNRLEAEELLASWSRDDLQAAIQEGIDAADRGDTFSMEEVKAHLAALHRSK